MDEEKFRPRQEINFVLEDEWLFIMNTAGQLLVFRRHHHQIHNALVPTWRIVNATKEGRKDG